MSREPSDLWQDEYQSKFLSNNEESHMLDLIEEMIEDDFLDVLFSATQVNDGYKERSRDIMYIIRQIHHNSGNKETYAALGEYLYLLAYDYADDSVTKTFTRFE